MWLPVELTGLGGSVDGYAIEHAGTCSGAFSYSIQKTMTEDETGTECNELEKSLISNHWFKYSILSLNILLWICDSWIGSR